MSRKKPIVFNALNKGNPLSELTPNDVIDTSVLKYVPTETYNANDLIGYLGQVYRVINNGTVGVTPAIGASYDQNIINGATVNTATNIAGGTANSVLYQSGIGATTSLSPAVGALVYTGSALAYQTAPTLLGTNFTNIPNAATTATASNTVSTIVQRDVSGNFSAGTITATLNGAATSAGTAGSATLATNLAGGVAASLVVQAGSNSTAFLSPSLGVVQYNGSIIQYSTAPTITGTNITGIPNAATTATSANTPLTIVSRDASGNFSAGIITADLTGTASGNQLLVATPTNGNITQTNGSGQTIDSGKTFSIDATFATPTNNTVPTSLAVSTYVQNQVASVLKIQGSWNASTNTPTLTAGVGTAGFSYYVTVAGTQTLPSGTSTFYNVGDLIFYTNTGIWDNLSGGNSVLSVNGQTGVVSLGIVNMNDATITAPSNGQTLIYNSTTSKWENATPAGGGTVTNVSGLSANGFNLVFTNQSTTPVGTISTTITGLIKGNGTAISAAVLGTDYGSVPTGGTGLTTVAAGQLLYGNGTSPLSSSANLFFDPTNIFLGVGTSTPNAPIQLGNSSPDSRKIIMNEIANNVHQYAGFGNNGTNILYQSYALGLHHQFRVGTSSTTSNVLMTINTNGNVGISNASQNGNLQFPSVTNNRKIVMFETANNDHEFIGFGVNGSILRYQTDQTTADHVFYAGTSSTTSNELFRIFGAGNVRMNGTFLNYSTSATPVWDSFGSARLQYDAFASTDDMTFRYLRSGGTVGTTGQVNFTIATGAGGQLARFAFNGTGGTAYLNNTGFYGENISDPHAPIHLNTFASRRKIILFETANNDFQFFGFGVQAGALEYHSPSTGDDHVFFAGTSSSSMNELGRFFGTGNFSIQGGVATKSTGTTWANPSDARIKTDVQPYTSGLDVALKLRPITYKFNKVSGQEDLKSSHIGFIADEIQKVCPEMVSVIDDSEGNTGLKDLKILNESALTKILLNSIVEQQEQIEQLKKQINLLNKKIK